MPSLPMMQAVLDVLPDAVFCVERHGMRLNQVNRAACACLGYTPEELQGTNLCDLCPPQDVAALAQRLDGALQGDCPNSRLSENGTVPFSARIETGPLPGEPATAILCTTLRSKSGLAIPAEWHVSQVWKGRAEYWIVVARTLSPADRADVPRALQTDAYGLGLPGHDPLTGLPDRRLFDRRLGRAMERLQRGVGGELNGDSPIFAETRIGTVPFAVCFIDLDGFKAVNDSFGHLVGDRVLCEVARRLVGCVRPGDMAARYGGDEFTVFLDDMQSEADAALVARRILEQLQMPATIDGREVKLTASIGVALSCGAGVPPAQADGTATPRDCRRIQDLLHRADRAMYRAKSLGGGQWAIFDEESGSRT